MKVEREKPASTEGAGNCGPRRKLRASKLREKADRKDLEILNRRADALNAESEDVLGYQALR